MLILGDDWAEARHDIELQNVDGRVLVRRRLPEGVAGIAELHSLVGDHLGDEEPDQVLVGIGVVDAYAAAVAGRGHRGDGAADRRVGGAGEGGFWAGTRTLRST